VEIPVELMIVEFNRHSVVAVLVYSPDKPYQIQTEIFAVTSPRGRSRLEGLVVLSFQVLALGGSVWKSFGPGKCALAVDIQSISSSIVINNEVIVFQKKTVQRTIH